MIAIPAGRFSMGSSKDDIDARANERPRHQVTIAAPIAVAKFEATFDEWDAWRRRRVPAGPGRLGTRANDRG